MVFYKYVLDYILEIECMVESLLKKELVFWKKGLCYIINRE